MRQAGWNEIFSARREGIAFTPEVPQEPSGWRRLVWWEDLVSFGLLAAIVLSVVAAIQQAHWVDSMPPLFPIALLGLLMGALLSRLRWPEGFIHLIALPVGAAGILGQLIGIMSGATPWDRYRELHTRMGEWFTIAFTGGISNDDLPFILLVVSLCWLVAYWSAWAIFRWQNVWLALLPAGGALTANFAFQRAEFSFSFVIFLLGGALLMTRLHTMERSREWREEQTPYPPMLSLSVMHATFWIVVVLLSIAWAMPRADESGALDGTWNRATAPIQQRIEGLSRLFVSVDVKKPVRIHDFNDYLPFLGSVGLPNRDALEIVGGPLDDVTYLRAEAYYLYNDVGWQQGLSNAEFLAEGESTQVNENIASREDISVLVINRSEKDDTIFTIGQPLQTDIRTHAEWWRNQQDVTGLQAAESLDTGDRYESTGSVSVADEQTLREAGEQYPAWIYDRYMQLPQDFPDRVRDLAAEIAGSEATPYDEALALQDYLRGIPYDLDVPDTPRGEDPIDYFLFEGQRGYFDYHASAMVVMLRSLGVPSRLAVGYTIQPSEGDGEVFRYQINERDAFAWPEVYFPGLGWVEFNPTPKPGVPAVTRPGGGGAGAAGEGTNVLPPPGQTLDNWAGLLPEDGAPDLPALATPNGPSSSATQLVLIAIASGIAVLFVGGAGGAGYAWMRGLRGLDAPTRLWEQTVRLASWTRLPALDASTPQEYARTLRKEAGAPEVEALADAYVRHRFGGQAIDSDETEGLEQAWRSVRGQMLRRLWPF